MSERLFQITVRDSGNVYKDIEDFAAEVRAMAVEYGLPADIVDVVDITSGAKVRGSSPAGRPSPPSSSSSFPEDDQFHDVAGARV